MPISQIVQRIEALNDEANLTRLPCELTGALANALRIARQIEAQANCPHTKTDEDVTTQGRRERVITCVSCNHTLSREEV